MGYRTTGPCISKRRPRSDISTLKRLDRLSAERMTNSLGSNRRGVFACHQALKTKKVLYIIGWAEEIDGGWIGYARDDAGATHRTACRRANQADAIHAARGLVTILRQEQIRMRRLNTDTYDRTTDTTTPCANPTESEAA